MHKQYSSKLFKVYLCSFRHLRTAIKASEPSKTVLIDWQTSHDGLFWEQWQGIKPFIFIGMLIKVNALGVYNDYFVGEYFQVSASEFVPPSRSTAEHSFPYSNRSNNGITATSSSPSPAKFVTNASFTTLTSKT